MRRRRVMAALLAALLAVLAASAVHTEAVASERFGREAIALFRAVLAGERLKACAIDDHWLAYDPPQALVRAHVGSMAGGERPMPSPAAVLDPGGVQPQAFCDAEEARRRRQTQLEAFAGVPEPDPSGDRLVIASRAYARPLFDAGFRRAVVISLTEAGTWIRTPGGAVKSLGYEGAIVAAVYVKRGGRWRFRTREELASYH
jgi:hypothetical protein